MSNLHESIIEELRALRAQRPPWLLGATYDDPDEALDPLDRRERDKLTRLYREERQGWRERTRERVARERNQPWKSEEGWGIRKRLWRERRDQERELLDQRESAILGRDEDLRHWLSLYERRLAELALLAPENASWCAAMGRDQLDPPSAEDLSAVWERYRAACACRAEGLLAQSDMRQRLEPIRHASDQDAAQAITSLVGDSRPLVAGVLAALIVATLVHQETP